MAATSTLVAELSSQLVSASESGLGRTRIFVKFIISKHPTAVLDAGWGGGGVDKGDISCPGPPPIMQNAFCRFSYFVVSKVCAGLGELS